MENILFSIIIAYYNTADTLIKLLDSIPHDPDIEVIVVDDRSTENKEAFDAIKEKEQSDNRIFLENTGTGKGCGAARNVGLRKASGKWLLFADADDYFLEGAFDEQRSHSESEADQIFFSPVSINVVTGEPAKRHVFYENLIRKYLSDPSDQNERNNEWLVQDVAYC